jgi:hypothetical protein
MATSQSPTAAPELGRRADGSDRSRVGATLTERTIEVSSATKDRDVRLYRY